MADVLVHSRGASYPAAPRANLPSGSRTTIPTNGTFVG